MIKFLSKSISNLFFWSFIAIYLVLFIGCSDIQLNGIIRNRTVGQVYFLI